MKKTLLLLLSIVSFVTLHGQFVVIMQVTEPIEGICDDKRVYTMFASFDGQEEAICPLSDEEILNRLNSEVQFLKDNPKYKDKGMIGLIINCKGEVVMCEMDNKTQSPELDKQIEDIFNSLGEWAPAKLEGEEVDSSILYSFKIKKGVFSFK